MVIGSNSASRIMKEPRAGRGFNSILLKSAPKYTIKWRFCLRAWRIAGELPAGFRPLRGRERIWGPGGVDIPPGPQIRIVIDGIRRRAM
jgi:hypothetical protein